MFALAMTGLNFALWLNAMNLLGVGATPATEGGQHPGRTVGAAGSLIGAIALITTAIWYGWTQPIPNAPAVNGLFSLTTGMYGFLWVGVFFAQVYGFDWQHIANLCLIVAVMQVIGIIALFTLLGTSLPVLLIGIVLFTYVVLLVMFNRLLYGKMDARPVGLWLVVTTIGTFYLQFVASGIFNAPGT